jgi:hypothetical protein
MHTHAKKSQALSEAKDFTEQPAILVPAEGPSLRSGRQAVAAMHIRAQK